MIKSNCTLQDPDSRGAYILETIAPEEGLVEALEERQPRDKTPNIDARHVCREQNERRSDERASGDGDRILADGLCGTVCVDY